jgi:hypothetical protein
MNNTYQLDNWRCLGCGREAMPGQILLLLPDERGPARWTCSKTCATLVTIVEAAAALPEAP